MELPDALSIPLFQAMRSSTIGGSAMGYQQNIGYNYQSARLVITRQPRKRGYRFRYASEGKTHGMLPGEVDSKNANAKVFPTIKLENHRGPAKVVMTLVTDREPFHMHAHTLLVDKSPAKGYHVFELKPGEFNLELKNIAIQHAVKETLNDTLSERILQTRFTRDVGSGSYLQQSFNNPDKTLRININAYIKSLQDKEKKQNFYDRKTKIEILGPAQTELREEAKKLSKLMNMSSCRLCFVTFLQDPAGNFTQPLDPVYSDEIIDGKKKEGAPLKIVRTSHVAGSVEGGKEIWLLSDKVDADDTEVHFWEKKEHKQGIYWEALGEFNKTDVYKQALIVFHTPPYIDQNIDQPRSVNMQLRRKKDRQCVSDIHQFMYKPKHYDRYGLREKRRKQIPAGLYGPPAKRPATGDEPSHLSNDHADGSENPTLSDFVFSPLKESPPTLNGVEESSNGYNFNPQLYGQWPSTSQSVSINQLLASYTTPSSEGEESRGS